MTLFNLTELPARLDKAPRLIGLDPGSKTIGVALSDVSRLIASPYTTLKRSKLSQIAAELSTIATREAAGGLIVGLPLQLDGTFGPAAQAARDWALALSNTLNLPTTLWDERLSSAAVNRFLIQTANLTRTKRAAAVDRAAAAYILQGALDALRK